MSDSVGSSSNNNSNNKRADDDHHDQQRDAKRARLEGSTSRGSEIAASTSASIAGAGNGDSSDRNNDGSSRQQRGRGRGGRGGGGGRGGRRGREWKGKGVGQTPRDQNGRSGQQRGDAGQQRSRDAARMQQDNDDDGDGDGKVKLPKKKVALVIGYSGLGYSGSQIQNPGVETIESEVFAACVKAGCISEDNSDNPNKVHLMRAARTDAGVSAAINVLNLKLIMQPPSLPPGTALEDHINTFLPDSIRVWSVIRVQGGFHARTMCDSRMYNYSLPTYCFLEPKEGSIMAQKVSWKDAEDKEQSVWRRTATTSSSQQEDRAEPTSSSAGQPATAADSQEAQAEPSSTSSTTFQVDHAIRKAYRLPPEILQTIRDTMDKFSGSHNFWNFTVGKEFGDRSCQRNMKKLTVTDPFMVKDSEWISLKFHGQSFMLHQIRKMVGLVILMVRTRTPPSLVSECFGPARLNIPKAPSLGLLLEQPIFENYNRKVADSNRRAEDGKLQALGRKVSKANEAKREQNGGEDVQVAKAGLEQESSLASEHGNVDDTAVVQEHDKVEPVYETPASSGVEKQPTSSSSGTTAMNAGATATADSQPGAVEDSSADLLRDPVAYDAISDKVEAFKREIVFKAMHEEEERDDTYAKWLNLHDYQVTTEYDYLNAKGIIPQSAIMNKKPQPPQHAKRSEVMQNTTAAGADSTSASTGTTTNGQNAGITNPGRRVNDDDDTNQRRIKDEAKEAEEEEEEEARLLARYSGKHAAELEG